MSNILQELFHSRRLFAFAEASESIEKSEPELAAASASNSQTHPQAAASLGNGSAYPGRSGRQPKYVTPVDELDNSDVESAQVSHHPRACQLPSTQCSFITCVKLMYIFPQEINVSNFSDSGF